jgi:hypothetical protein
MTIGHRRLNFTATCTAAECEWNERKAGGHSSHQNPNQPLRAMYEIWIATSRYCPVTRCSDHGAGVVWAGAN